MKKEQPPTSDSYSLSNRIKRIFSKIIRLLFNPRLLLCFGIAWLITNGWAYIALGVSIFYDIVWLGAVASVYLSALWFPLTPEKIITVIIAIWLLNRLFPNDQKTLAVLRDELTKIKNITRRRKQQQEPQSTIDDEQECPKDQQNDQKND